MFGNIKSKRKEKTEEGVYKLFYDEVTEFKQAASDLQLKIQLDDQKGTLSVGKKSTTR